MTANPRFDLPDWIIAIRAILGECINHDHEQVGRCVYCKTCGRRLYQGTIALPDEMAALRKAMKEYARP